MVKRTQAEMRPGERRLPRVNATAWMKDNSGFSLTPGVELERMDKCVICLVGKIPNLATLVLQVFQKALYCTFNFSLSLYC